MISLSCSGVNLTDFSLFMLLMNLSIVANSIWESGGIAIAISGVEKGNLEALSCSSKVGIYLEARLTVPAFFERLLMAYTTATIVVIIIAPKIEIEIAIVVLLLMMSLFMAKPSTKRRIQIL